MAKVGLLARSRQKRSVDGIVDAALTLPVSANGYWVTLQGADDFLGVTGYTLLVKQGTYAAGVTVATARCQVLCEAGTIVQAAVTMSAVADLLELLSGCDIQALVTMSGASGLLLARNGVNFDGIVISGSGGMFSGGGIGSNSNGGIAAYGISLVTGTDITAELSIARTTGAGGTNYDAVRVESTRGLIRLLKALNSDRHGVEVPATVTDTIVLLVTVTTADERGIDLWAPRSIVAANYLQASGQEGLYMGDAGDNSVASGNVIHGNVGNSITVAALCEDCCVVGNRVNGAVNDLSGTSTVAQNVVAAF